MPEGVFNSLAIALGQGLRLRLRLRLWIFTSLETVDITTMISSLSQLRPSSSILPSFLTREIVPQDYSNLWAPRNGNCDAEGLSTGEVDRLRHEPLTLCRLALVAAS